MNRTAIYAIGAALVIAGLGIMAWRAHRTITSNLPVPIMCVNEADARNKAGLYGIPVLGTGSMSYEIDGKPYIPAAPKGFDPRATKVAYVTLVPEAKFEDIKAGDLCLYYADWAKGLVLHVAALLDSFGWIMSGTNNARSEPHWRVTSVNFRGIVKDVYVWPQ